MAAALSILAAGAVHPLFRHTEGHMGAAFVVPMALAAAVLVLGFAAGTGWTASARWLGLALVGQAVSLQLIEAGRWVGYQHYPPPPALFSAAHAPVLLFLAVQTVAVAVAAGGRLRQWVAALRGVIAPWRLVLVAGVFVLTSATLSAHVATYAAELIFATYVQALHLATIVLAAVALPDHGLPGLRSRFDRLFGAAAAGAEPGGVDRFALAAAAGVLVACSLLARFVYQAHPHVPDEVVYLYHARYFAAGMLSLPLPAVPAAFELDLMTYEANRWYSPVPPGWPAALAVGAFFGAAWLVNPVLNAINVLLAYVVLRELYDRRTARIATLLLCVSPWFLFMGMNLMTHTFTLTCGLAAALAVARLRRGGSPAWILAGGAAIGVTGIIRPLEGLTVAVLLGFWALGGLPWSVSRMARVAALAVVAIATGALTLPYNAHMAGHPLTFPLMAYTDSIYGPGVNALGFGPDRGIAWPGLDPFPGHGLPDVLVNASLNTSGVNIELFGWSIGSLLPLALLLAAGSLSRPDVRMLTVIVAIVGVHSLYWFSGGPDFGARYWYLIIVPCMALTARGLSVVAERLARPPAARARGAVAAAGAPQAAGLVQTRTLAGALLLCAIALVAFVPWRAMDKYHHYRNMRPDVRRLAAEHDFGRSLVLVRGRRHPDYASAAIYNPLDLRADEPVYIWDRDPDITRQALLEYADRSVWIVDGPSVTGAGFRIAAGPMPARWLLLPQPDSVR